jgi:preprotein translocase subunit SecD
MRRKRLIVWVIGFLTLTALLIDLPRFPLRIHFRNFTFETTLGGYSLDFHLLGRKFKKEFPLRLGLDLSGGIHLTLEADMEEIDLSEREIALEAARNVIERRVNLYGFTEPLIQSAKIGKSYRIVVELAQVRDVEEAVQLLGQTAKLEFREFKEEIATPSATFPTLANTSSTGVTGRDLRRAQLDFDPNTGKPVVAFELTSEGGKKFEEVTSRLIGKPLAIFLDVLPISWPIVQDVIVDKGTITGQFTTGQAKNLALQLSAGALPVPVKVVEKRTVGATLGRASIEKSVRAGSVGLLVVAGFMVAYYGSLGLLADLALIIYGLLSLAIFKLIPLTLTLPGVAGFLLSIGMAVDSNILIFERIKEEIRAGKGATSAVELGFGRAWDSIRDANICTIITCFVLFNPLNFSFLNTSGMIRGFAATLFIGIIVSLFTGVVVTKTLLRTFVRTKD